MKSSMSIARVWDFYVCRYNCTFLILHFGTISFMHVYSWWQYNLKAILMTDYLMFVWCSCCYCCCCYCCYCCSIFFAYTYMYVDWLEFGWYSPSSGADEECIWIWRERSHESEWMPAVHYISVPHPLIRAHLHVYNFTDLRCRGFNKLSVLLDAVDLKC